MKPIPDMSSTHGRPSARRHGQELARQEVALTLEKAEVRHNCLTEHWHLVDVMVDNVTFFIAFAVFDVLVAARRR